MTDVEKATRAIWAVYDELSRWGTEDAIQLIEMVYQCGQLQAEEFVFAVECIYDMEIK